MGFDTGQVISSSKCASTSPEAGRLRTKLVTSNISHKAPYAKMRSSDSKEA